MSLLEINNICMYFGGLKALEDISFNVERDLITSVIGPNGAGKTTLFNVLTGLYSPTSGTVFFNEERIDNLPSYKLVSKGISRTFQNIRLLKEMTVLENVQLGHHNELKQNFFDVILNNKKFSEEEKRSKDKALEILDFVGLLKYKDEKAKNLPYGSQKLLEIARTLATESELLLFDEPCAGINKSEKDKLSEIIININKDLGKTIVLIEHDMRFVMSLSDSVVVLNQGELLAIGTPDEIQKNSDVIDAYLGTSSKRSENHVANH